MTEVVRVAAQGCYYISFLRVAAQSRCYYISKNKGVRHLEELGRECVMLFVMLSGYVYLPFDGPNPLIVLKRVITADFHDPT